MKKIFIGDSWLEYRETPWDTRSFEIPTKEILDMEYENEEVLTQLMEEFEKELESESLVYFRRDSNDMVVKKVLLSRGYYIAECACLMKLARFKKIDFSRIYKNDLPLDTEYDEKDIRALQEIARESFHYSRFHEDPFIDLEKAKKRYENWVLDLVEQGKELFLYRNDEGEIISFLFYEVIDKKANLILGGSKDGYGMMTLYFFSTILTHFQKNRPDIKKIEVMISASNLGILNTYITFGFTDQTTFFDYHRIFGRDRV